MAKETEFDPARTVKMARQNETELARLEAKELELKAELAETKGAIRKLSSRGRQIIKEEGDVNLFNAKPDNQHPEPAPAKKRATKPAPNTAQGEAPKNDPSQAVGDWRDTPLGHLVGVSGQLPGAPEVKAKDAEAAAAAGVKTAGEWSKMKAARVEKVKEAVGKAGFDRIDKVVQAMAQAASAPTQAPATEAPVTPEGEPVKADDQEGAY